MRFQPIHLIVCVLMRIGIVSDIHGNIKALDIALDRMGQVDEIWCPGDAINQYEFSNSVVARLRQIGARYILGNHEEVFLSSAGTRARNHMSIDPVLLDWMSNRPHFVEDIINHRKILMFHSTPWEPYGEYLYPHTPDLNRIGDLDIDIAIYGHTHTPLSKTINGTLIVNPGSVGLSNDTSPNRHLSYAVLDIATCTVVFDQFEDLKSDVPNES